MIKFKFYVGSSSISLKVVCLREWTQLRRDPAAWTQSKFPPVVYCHRCCSLLLHLFLLVLPACAKAGPYGWRITMNTRNLKFGLSKSWLELMVSSYSLRPIIIVALANSVDIEEEKNCNALIKDQGTHFLPLLPSTYLASYLFIRWTVDNVT
jgi:hypothetical protein